MATKDIHITGSEPGIVAYWKMNELPGSATALDFSGNSYNATLTNMEPATDWVVSGSGMPSNNPVLLSVSDLSGNTQYCTGQITVLDTIVPNAVCQNATVELDISGNATVATSQVDNGSTDNCSIDSMAVVPGTFNCGNVGGVNVLLTVYDVNGNTDTCSSVVTVRDTIAPTAICQADTAYLDTLGTATPNANGLNNGSTDDCSIDTLYTSPATFGCSDVGLNNITLFVRDFSGNIDSCVTTIEVIDTIIPVATCQDVTIILDATGSATLSTSQIDNGSAASCGIASYSLSKTNYTCADVIADAPIALEFDGADDLIDIGTIAGTDPMAMAASDFTFSFWINPVLTGDAFQRIIDKSTGGPANNGYSIYFHSNDNIRVAIDGTVVLTGNSPVVAGVWQHIAVVGDGSNYHIYKDGINVGTSTGSYVNPPATTTNMYLASRNNGFGREYKGQMDEVRIWTIARSQAQIQADMNQPLDGNEPGLLAYWTFQDGVGSTNVTDFSGNGYNGTLVDLSLIHI